MNLIGMALTKPILIGCAAVVGALLLVILGQGIAIKYLDGKIDTERARYAQLQEKNGRCEAEASGLKGSLDTQSKAVGDLKTACSAAQTTANAAIAVAQGLRPASAKQIADILAGKPSDAADLCKSACVELRKEVRR